MRNLSLGRLDVIALLLIAATLFSWESTAVVADMRVATCAIILIAFAKVRYVGLDFMELRNAPLWLRGAFEAWVVLLGSGLVALYLLG
jgi:hypothetical protein